MTEKNRFEPETSAKDRMWKIRALIQKLEGIKDEIIKYWHSHENFDESSKDIWSGDIKEFYYNMVAAWEMLDALVNGEKQYYDSCIVSLEKGKSHWAQCASELRALNESRAAILNSELEETFKQSYTAIIMEVKNFAPKKKLEKPEKKIYKISEKEYQFPCSICGKISVILKIDIDTWSKKEALIYTGITHQVALPLNLAIPLFKLLETEQISQVHQILRDYVTMEDGIDAYCPELDAL
jgi:hypothetical protein